MIAEVTILMVTASLFSSKIAKMLSFLAKLKLEHTS